MKRLFPLAFILCLIAGILTGCSGSSSQESSPPPMSMYKVPDAPACNVKLELHGSKSYEENAVTGQICILYKESVSPQEALEQLTYNEFKILDQQPEIGYYLVEVEPGLEGDVVAWIDKYWEVDYVYLNAIYDEKSAFSYVIDGFDDDHGSMVSEMMSEASFRDVDSFDAQSKFRKKALNYDKIRFGISYSLYLHKGNDVVINLSIAPELGNNLERPLWNEERITDEDRDYYIKKYVASLVGFVKYTRRVYSSWLSNDFVIVKAAGNEGMKHMDWIFKEIKEKLSKEEYEFFKEHFLIVSAKDDAYRGDEYPNDVYEGGYHELFSKVDISDKTLENLHWQGTSFAAPRLAGYIVRAANRHKMKATEVLPLVRKATKKSHNHVIDYDMIEAEIELYNRYKNGGYDEYLKIDAMYFAPLEKAIGEWLNSYNEYIIFPFNEYLKLQTLCGRDNKEDVTMELRLRFGFADYEALQQWLIDNGVHFIIKVQTNGGISLDDIEDSEEYY